MLSLVSAAAAFAADTTKYPLFDDESPTDGRVIWIANCEGCHAYGIAGSPNPLKPQDWADRARKDRETLYSHAIEGFFGPEDTMMPPRGGNDALSDTEVKAAVDYMLSLALHYQNNK